MVKVLEGFTPYRRKDAEKYNNFLWWAGLTFGDILDRAADIHPEKEAFVDGKTRLTYGEARERTNKLALGLMGLGIQPPTPTWGGMLADGRVYLATSWWLATFPGLVIMLVVLGINLLGNWLRDMLDPRLTQL